MRARGELNPLRAVRMCQQVDAFACFTHDTEADGHGARIASMPTTRHDRNAQKANCSNQVSMTGIRSQRSMKNSRELGGFHSLRMLRRRMGFNTNPRLKSEFEFKPTLNQLTFRSQLHASEELKRALSKSRQISAGSDFYSLAPFWLQ